MNAAPPTRESDLVRLAIRDAPRQASHSERSWRITPPRSWPTDFFVVPTATYQLLFVLIVLSHERRRLVQIAVTRHPTAAWTAQQLCEAFPNDEAPRFTILRYGREPRQLRIVHRPF